MPFTILIKNGRVVDPEAKRNGKFDVYITDNKIEYVGKPQKKYSNADKIIDATGLVITPGLIDMHTHLREPGSEKKETIATGAEAALFGGFTTIACMPNTDPVCDTEAQAEYVYLQATRTNKSNVFPIGAVTKGQKGETLAEMGQLAEGGVVAFSDDGQPIMSANLMIRSLTYAKMFNKTIISHCEDKTLAGNGVMNKGSISTKLGLSSIPAIAEELMVYRDAMLAEKVNAPVHIAHVSSAKSVAIIKEAKKRGVKITAEVTPHHLSLTEDLLETFNPAYKMNPPLRTANDVNALIKGLKEGVIDCVASDHAPHTPEEKEVELSNAPFGVIGLESTLGVLLTKLYHEKRVPLNTLIKAMTINPAKVLRLNTLGTLKKGFNADITIIDLNKNWKINVNDFKSKSRNCPFDGWKVKGKAVCAIVNGKVFDLI